ncbi:MAG TPA: hypothetical protein PLP08_17170, partial [Plasticicumulans sp.]|uniref:hypothetical protein n=1 Tax=Plasticicumulans sp. TaxID=2307179 RepID=UPI002CBF47DC
MPCRIAPASGSRIAFCCTATVQRPSSVAAGQRAADDGSGEAGSCGLKTRSCPENPFAGTGARRVGRFLKR